MSKISTLKRVKKTVFHVHTFRCKHAEEVSDEAYVKRALEHNLSSMRQPYYYWDEFWALVPDGIPTIVGCDAHRVCDLRGQKGGADQPLFSVQG